MSQEQNNDQQSGPEFGIQRVYVKDISFEAPNTPEIFTLEEWRPDVNLDLHTEAAPLDENAHEVVLRVTVTAKVGEKTAFIVEVKQAGIFSMEGFEKEDLHHMLGSFCPNILFPYAREAISSLVERGGFPSIYLAPINFEALYQQHATEGADTGTVN